MVEESRQARKGCAVYLLLPVGKTGGNEWDRQKTETGRTMQGGVTGNRQGAVSRRIVRNSRTAGISGKLFPDCQRKRGCTGQ